MKKYLPLSLLLLPAVSFGAVDVSTTATAIQTDLTAVATAIGSALLVAAGVAVAFKWGKGAIFS